MAWIKLVELKDDGIAHGSVFRFPACWPYESIVDLMVVYMPGSERRHGLVVSTGHKAGNILVKLPVEAELKDEIGLSTEWVLNNWKKWIYPDCEVSQVKYVRNYEVKE